VIRILEPGDEQPLDRFLRRHADGSVFLRSNVLGAGLRDQGRPRQATYAARWEGDQIVGVAAHCWNGNLVLQAPAGAGEVARRAVAGSGRRVSGVLGPWDQVSAALAELGLAETETSLRSREELLALDLSALRVPGPLAAAEVTCRLAEPSDVDRLAEWRRMYRIQTMGELDGPDLLPSSRAGVARAQPAGALVVLVRGGQLVSTCGFSARHPDCVQIGGVWTPPELRGRGYARAVVAGALLMARQAAVPRSVLYTDENNTAARRAYQALGYQRVGRHGMVMFRQAVFADRPGPRAS
jgi:RimJ/RimL family protein N-acetyltransferase